MLLAAESDYDELVLVYRKLMKWIPLGEIDHCGKPSIQPAGQPPNGSTAV